MVRNVTLIFGAIAVGIGGFLAGGWAGPQGRVAQAAPADDEKPAGGRVGYVHIPRVVNETRLARTHGAAIEAVRKTFAEKAEPLRATLRGRPLVAVTTGALPADPAARQAERDLEELERDARRELETTQNRLLAALYKEISLTVAGLAKDNSLDAVQAYALPPGTFDPNQIRGLLGGPAAMLYVRRDADFTDELIRRMDQRFADANPAADPE